MNDDQHKSKIIKMDFTKLDAFAKAISEHLAVDVGIMGDKNYRADKTMAVPIGKEGAVRLKGKLFARSQEGVSNADIGFIHEFGTSRIPKRSFLRMPLFLKSEQILKEVKEAGAFQKLWKGNFIGILRDLGIAAERAIEQAFDSKGFGSWAPLKSRDGSPLVDTGQLRRSISSAVVKL